MVSRARSRLARAILGLAAFGPACGGGGGGGEVVPVVIALPAELHDRVEVFLSFRTQDNSAPLEIALDGVPGATFAPVRLEDGALRLDQEVSVPVGRHRAALDFYLPWAAWQPDPQAAPCAGTPGCAFDPETGQSADPGCAPRCLLREFAHGEGVRLLLMRLTGGVTIESGGALDFGRIGFDTPALDAYDEDGDGLANLQEVVADEGRPRVTNPCRQDTDGDTVQDGFELGMGADPAVCDDQAPVISGLSVGAPSDPGGLYVNLADRDAGGVVVVSFTVDRPLSEAAGYPRVSVGEYAADCARESPDDPLRFACGYRLEGRETDGTRVVTVVVADLYGHLAQDTSQRLVFDFRPPGVAAVSVSYRPAADNPLDAVRLARVGTTVSVTAVADEELSIAPADVPRLTVPGLVDGELSPVGGFWSQTSASFALVIPEGAADGTYPASLAWRDRAGNPSQGLALTPGIAVKTSTPALSIRQDQVTFLRSPWGSAAPEALGGFTLPAGPIFALAPAEPLDPAATLPEDTFRVDGDPPSLVQLRSSATGGAILGSLRPGADGGWPRLQLAEVDVPFIHAVAFDGAGNPSVPVRIDHTEWVATPNPPVVGASPHRLWASQDAREHPAGLELEGGLQQAHPGPELAGADGQALVLSTSRSWASMDPVGVNPSGREAHGLAYDWTRGALVLFGGRQGGMTPVADTWEWTPAAGWREITPAGASPAPRIEPAMVFDSRRGKVILFGGGTGTGVFYDDTWEWDGEAWTELSPSGVRPRGRTSHALAYDSWRGRAVLFGGNSVVGKLDDTWEWDGEAWTDVTPAEGSPFRRRWPAMAFDSARGRVVLFGGETGLTPPDDTWEWDGEGWTEIFPSGPVPAPRQSFSMAYDELRQRTILFGGNHIGVPDLPDVWEWDGQAWLETPPASGDLAAPTARSGHVAAFSPAVGRMLVFGGVAATFPPEFPEELWQWDSGARRWQAWLASEERPSGRVGHATAYDAARAVTVVFGGLNASGGLADTWEWDGSGWRDRTPADPASSPSARRSAMAYDPERGVVVLFGGSDDQNHVYVDDTWEWDGLTWTRRCDGEPPEDTCASVPNARFMHAMAYDPVRRVVVLFGGDWIEDGHHYLQDTWEWDGVAWTEVTPADPGPSARSGHALVTDTGRGRLVLVGGWPYSDPDAYALTWAWDGWARAWSQVPAAVEPSWRRWSGLAYDPLLARVILFGGDDGDELQDTWELDPALGIWTEVPSTSPAPMARNEPSLVFDAAREQVVLFGGSAVQSYPEDMFVRETQADRRPAVQLDVDLSAMAADPASVVVERLEVRAHAGGELVPAAGGAQGAVLLAWRILGAGPGGWWPLAANEAPLTGGGLPDPALDPSARLGWRSEDLDPAQLLEPGRRRLYLQVRPVAASQRTPQYRDARLAADYLEARIRYRAP